MRRLRKAGPIVAALSLGTFAIAGPDWEEGNFATGDAGDLLDSAQVPIGQPPGSLLSTITGELEGLSFRTGAGDVQDLYQIFIDDPAGFSATTETFGGGGTSFDSQLWLFAFDGTGVLGTDGIGMGATLTAVSTDGSGAAVSTAGVYYLAISIDPVDPTTAAGAPLFTIAALGEVSGPDGPGGGSPLGDWTTGVAGGFYIIALNGAAFPADCPTDCANGDGEVTIVDLLELLAEWGTPPSHDCDVAPAGGDGAVDILDLLDLLGAWGSCFPAGPM